MNRTGQFIKLIPLLLALVVALALPLAGCRKAGGAGAGMGVRNRDFNIEVSISHLPRLYEPFTITGIFTPYEQDQTDAELLIGGGVYLDGERAWHGPLKKGETKVLSATFVFVKEGNTGVGASALGNSGFPNTSLPLNLHVTSEGSQWGLVLEGECPGVTIWLPGQPHTLPPGHAEVVDTTLVLNTTSEPRIEFILGREDITRLQQQGLFPADLRYQWRNLNTIDFSKFFLVALFLPLQPTPGQYVELADCNLIWEEGVLKGNYQTYTLPPEVQRPSRPVSAVEVRAFSRLEKPTGLDVLAFEGIRTFNFTLDGQPLPPIKADFGTPPARTP